MEDFLLQTFEQFIKMTFGSRTRISLHFAVICSRDGNRRHQESVMHLIVDQTISLVPFSAAALDYTYTGVQKREMSFNTGFCM